MRVTAPPVHDDDAVRVLAFGAQVDTRPVRTSRRADDPCRSLTPEQVAGYLVKYATKSTADTEVKDKLHLRRLEATARHLAGRAVTLEEDPDASYGLLGKWAHTLASAGTSPPSPAATRHPRPAAPREAARPGTDRRGQPGRHPGRAVPRDRPDPHGAAVGDLPALPGRHLGRRGLGR